MHHHEHHSDESCCGGARHHHTGFGKRGFKPPFGMGMPMHGFGPGGMRARRGDVRTAVLRLLAEQPMHGYQIIQELSARSEGAWSPSAGSVYPTLQQLADEDLVTAEETGGKKVFSLTGAGEAEVAKIADQPAPWEEAAQGDSGFGEYRGTVGKLMQAAFQIGTSGSREQRAAAVEVLTDARKKLYAILAED
jgi:DNA-binding PadR family transcriptional regulator